MAYLPVEVLHSIHLNHIATDAPLQVIREVLNRTQSAAKLLGTHARLPPSPDRFESCGGEEEPD